MKTDYKVICCVFDSFFLLLIKSLKSGPNLTSLPQYSIEKFYLSRKIIWKLGIWKIHYLLLFSVGQYCILNLNLNKLYSIIKVDGKFLLIYDTINCIHNIHYWNKCKKQLLMSYVIKWYTSIDC